MAYKEIFYHDYCEHKTGRACKLSILKKDYTGNARAVEAGPIPFRKAITESDYPLVGCIKPSMAILNLIVGGGLVMDDLYSDDDTTFAVEHHIEGVIDWLGFISAEGLSEVEGESLSMLEVNCFDGLTRLKETPFLDENGQNYGARPVPDMYFTELFGKLLQKTGIFLELHTLVDRVASLTSIPELERFSVYLSTNGWVEGQDLASEAFSSLVIGNYVAYRVPGQAGLRTSKVVGVDTSQVPLNMFAQFSPPLAKETAGAFDMEAAFYPATFSTTDDALAITLVSSRLWIEGSGKVSKSTDEKDGDQDEVPYYERPENAMMCWDILESIARAWDVIIYQRGERWIIESLDAHRMTDSYYRYDPDGDFLGRVARQVPVEIPECMDEVFYRAVGNTRYNEAARKKVTVQYNYRYKTEFDSPADMIYNGSFTLPQGTVTPSTFTPDGWKRGEDTAGYLVDRPYPGSPYIEIRRPTNGGISPSSYLNSRPIPVVKGDRINLAWRQSLLENAATGSTNLATNGAFSVFKVEIITPGGDIYFLVNSGDREDWDDRVTQSGTLKGRWEKGKASEPQYLMVNHTTAHYTGSGSGFSALSQVEVLSGEAPETGNLTVFILGAANRIITFGSSDKTVRGYVPETRNSKYDEDDRGVKYVENDPGSITSPVLFGNGYSGLPEPTLRITGLALELVAGDRNPGRVYEYEHPGVVKEALDTIEIPFGDESNEHLLSSIFTNGQVRPLWRNRAGDLQAGPFGLVLARAIMRRYFTVNKRIDGTIGVMPLDFSRVIDMKAYAGKTWKILSGTIDHTDSEFSGTLYELTNVTLPNGGFDFGPNSLLEK